MSITVLHVVEALETGVARHVVDVVEHTPRVRHEVAAPPFRLGGEPADSKALDRMREAGAVVHRVPMRRLPVALRNGRAVARIRRLALERGAVVVHGHSSIGGAVARLAAPRGVGRVYTPNGVMTAPPVVALERLLGRRTDRLVAVSPSEAELVAALGFVAPDRVVTIPNGVAPTPVSGTAIDLRALLGIPASAPIVGSVGRLVPQKAPLDFVAMSARIAWARPDAHFVLVGRGKLGARVDAAVRARQELQGRFHTLLHLPGASAVLGQLDVYVQASQYEGCPYVPLEAMAAGTPVVLTDAVGNRDVVEDGVSGLLAPVGDIEALAQCVERLLTNGPLRAALATAAAARVRQRFDVRTMGLALADLYEELAASMR